MRKKIIIRMLKKILIVLAVIAIGIVGLVAYSENIKKIPLIENIKQALEERTS